MLVRLASVAAVAVGLLSLAGCGPAKLNQTRAYDLDVGELDGFFLDKQSKPQKVTIEFTSSAGEVSVLLFKAEDAKGDAALETDPAKALGFKTGKGETFVVDVPENTETRLVVRNATKTTKVNVKVTN
jgi:hypothetical protein